MTDPTSDRPARPIKLTVTGTHSTGKTTLLTALTEVLTEHGYKVAGVADLGVEARELGFPILYHHTPRSTLWIITRGISLELQAERTADIVLVDRPVADALAYYEAAIAYRGEITPSFWQEYLTDLTAHHSHTYDLTYKTILDPAIPLGLDKPRDTDCDYRTLADTMITKILQNLQISHNEVDTGRLTPEDIAETIAADVMRLRHECTSRSD